MATKTAPEKTAKLPAAKPAPAAPLDDDQGASREIQKLQRAIVDGLEDVKAQNIQVFNTAHLSPLFERVVIASGTSNRQTKALAGSVRDAVREAGFSKPRMEGEDNGEWIIVDCGSAVVHIMQPAIRQYYTLEDIWGERPVHMRLGKAPAKRAPARKAAATSSASKAGTTSGPASVPKAAKPAAKARPGTAMASQATGRKAAAATGTKAPARTRAATAAPKAAPKAPARSAPTATTKAAASTKTGGRGASGRTVAKTGAARPAAPKKPAARK